MYFNHKEDKIKTKKLGLIIDDMNEMLYIATTTVKNKEQLKYLSNMVLTIIINVGKIKNKALDIKRYPDFENLIKTTYTELIEELGEDYKEKNDFVESVYYNWLETYYIDILEQGK